MGHFGAPLSPHRASGAPRAPRPATRRRRAARRIMNAVQAHPAAPRRADSATRHGRRHATAVVTAAVTPPPARACARFHAPSALLPRPLLVLFVLLGRRVAQGPEARPRRVPLRRRRRALRGRVGARLQGRRGRRDAQERRAARGRLEGRQAHGQGRVHVRRGLAVAQPRPLDQPRDLEIGATPQRIALTSLAEDTGTRGTPQRSTHKVETHTRAALPTSKDGGGRRLASTAPTQRRRRRRRQPPIAVGGCG